MKEKITAQVGQIIEVNGKSYRAAEGGFEPVVERGPLGGEIKRLDQCKVGQRVIVRATVGDNCSLGFDSLIGRNLLVETDIPPRPTFTPMTAGEAAALPDIVGRWVAVKVEKTDSSNVPLAVSGHKCSVWFDSDDQILLIEGVDL